jgi:carbon storage regulator CsrA
MLVLTRKSKQQIQIGPHITVTILQIKGQAVRVGIEAPREICVLRTEIAEKMAAQADYDPTVMAALEKARRESEISSTSASEDKSGQALSPMKNSLRCRAPRVDGAPLMNPPYQSTGPASSLRRRRLALR